MNDAHLELLGIRKEYAGVVAVERVDLKVARGEFLVLLGPSGSGKTTILSMMGGFTVPTKGHKHIDGLFDRNTLDALLVMMMMMMMVMMMFFFEGYIIT